MNRWKSTDGGRDDRGAVLMIVAISLAVLVISTAFTIDLGRLMLRNRDLQAIADLASLDAARNLDGRTVSQIQADSNFAAAIQRSMDRNNFPSGGDRQWSYTLGYVTPDRQFIALTGSSVPNAVKVSASDIVDYFFAPGNHSASKSSVGLAATSPTCVSPDPACTTYMSSATLDYELGSFLASASLNDSQVKLLNALFTKNGNTVNLTAVSYQGIAGTQLTMRQLSTALGLASPDALFSGTIGYKRFIQASADALQANGGPVAAISALNTLAASANGSSSFSFGSLVKKGSGFQVNQGVGPSSFDVAFKVLNLLEGSAFLVNGSNALTVPGLTIDTPRGITSTDVTMTVVEGPRVISGAKVGDQASTSQVTLTLTNTINKDVSALIAGGNLRGTVTVSPQIGASTASPSAITCSGATPTSATVGVTSTPVTVTTSDSLTLAATVLVAPIDVLSTTAASTSTSTPGAAGSTSFTYAGDFLPSTGSGSMHRVGNSSLNVSSTLTATSSNSTVLAGSINISTLTNVVNQTMTGSILPSLQNTIVPQILQTLGLEVGGADIGAVNETCTGPVIIK